MGINLFKWRRWPYTLDFSAMDNNGNGGLFIQIYDTVYDPAKHDKNQSKLSDAFEEYCLQNIHGVVKVTSNFGHGVFIGAKLFFKDEASMTWFKLTWE